jgi:DNA invertase Pin-like site-specific DNA recombinase
VTRRWAALVRVSSSQQDEERQKKAIRQIARERGCPVDPDLWFFDKESRDRSDKRPEFQRLMGLMEQGQIAGIYVEKQDRFGVSNAKEWGKWMYELDMAGCKLIEAATGRDLTASDMATYFMGGIGADASEKEQINIGRRTLGGKVARARDARACWNGGTAPWGFDKACYGSQGEILWFFHYLARNRGVQVFPCERCRRVPRGLEGNRPCPECRRVPRSKEAGDMPRKRGTAGEKVLLVPSEDQSRVDMARQVFKWYVELSWHTTGVAKMCRQRGWTIYGKPITHERVRFILENPAYVGAYAFGRSESARFAHFNGEAVVDLPAPESGRRVEKRRRRPPEEWIVREGEWPGLIDRETWERVQVKLKARETAPRPPRSSKAWLKGLLYCGQCRRPLVVRSLNPVSYYCATYHEKHMLDGPGDCHCNCVTHERALALIADKLRELKIDLTAGGDRSAILELYKAKGQKIDAVARLIRDGAARWADLLTARFALDDGAADSRLAALVRKFKKLVGYSAADSPQDWALDFLFCHTTWLEPGEGNVDHLRTDAAAVRELLAAVEEETRAEAGRRLEALKGKYARLVLAKARADSDRELAEVRRQLAECEEEMDSLEEHLTPLADRQAALLAEVKEYTARIKDAEEALAGEEDMRKAETVKRVLGKVTLYFDVVPKRGLVRTPLLPERTEWEMLPTAGSC